MARAVMASPRACRRLAQLQLIGAVLVGSSVPSPCRAQTIAVTGASSCPACPFEDLFPALQAYTGTDASSCVQTGAGHFKRNQVAESAADFDRALQLDQSQAPYLWQRGLTLFYAERLSDAMAQFSMDVSANPNDTEETIWHMLSNIRHRVRDRNQTCQVAVAAARGELLPVGRDSRPVMRNVMKMFRGEVNPQSLDTLATQNSASNAYFYVHLYRGLYFEAMCDTVKSNTEMLKAVHSGYGGQQSSDYMWHLARVHLRRRRRGWLNPKRPNGATVVTECTDLAAVRASCGQGGSSKGPPPACTLRCARTFSPWFLRCGSTIPADLGFDAFEEKCAAVLPDGPGGGRPGVH